MPYVAPIDDALPIPDPGRADAERWVRQHLDGLYAEQPGEVAASPRFRGGQRAAEAALAAFDVTGYARNRNETYPVPRRAASGLSPYIRHGLLTLPRVWDAVGGGPLEDVRRFRDELLWQEYARHWYARLGPATAHPVRHTYASGLRRHPPDRPPWSEEDEEMACVELTVGELEDDGWLVNQARMWLASHWTVRLGRDWVDGEEYFFRHLLDGSRAANRLGWQWATGVGSARAYGFSRWQVERRAPGLCATCELGAACPIDRWPDGPDLVPVEPELVAPGLAGQSLDEAARLAGPAPGSDGAAPDPAASGSCAGEAQAVWLTAESLGCGHGPGAADPALAARPDLPAIFVFDRPLLARLRLSAKRLVFLVETLAELATRRPLEVRVGDPVEILSSRPLAATHTPVPGWRRRANALDLVEIHPWPWLRRPGPEPVGSYQIWRRQIEKSLNGPVGSGRYE